MITLAALRCRDVFFSLDRTYVRVYGMVTSSVFRKEVIDYGLLRCDFYFQFAEESSSRVEFTSAGGISPSIFASLHGILHRLLIAWPVQKERKYGSK